ncbi:hypothetical protein D8T48_21035 [Vibrio vulnificus]|nr:hypothetical protein D8T48_21035 [Vibrio vulnificus]
MIPFWPVTKLLAAETRRFNLAVFCSGVIINPLHSRYIANAALSGEQRQPPNLNHCILNTKFNLN